MSGLKINWKSLGAAAVTTLGLVAQNAGAYGPKAAPWLVALGILLQATSHPVASKQA